MHAIVLVVMPAVLVTAGDRNRQARFLEALETDPTLQPDPEWDDSIVALINYPEVVELLNADLDWTWRLGESVVAQQTDVIAAVETFRDRAYAAGNLKSDGYQTVANDEGYISISTAAEDVIYVPYYEPAQVVHYQPRPAYYYHPRPYPVYHYPYAANHYFDRGYFWGVTTAYSIGWYTDSLNVYHHSYRGHPYYGRTYWNDGWYRQPSINTYNTTYVNNTNITVNRHSDGDQWRARNERRRYVSREGYARAESHSTHRGLTRDRQREPIAFRERESRTANLRSETSQARSRDNTSRSRDTSSDAIRTSRRAETVVRARDTSRDVTTNRTPRHTTYQPQASRQTREQVPVRTSVRTAAPAPRERRQTETRSTVQPSRATEPRVQRSKNNTRKSATSTRRSNKQRSQRKDRRH